MSIYYTCPDCFSHVECGETCACKKPQDTDLAAENERLKAKLDEIKELAEEMVRASQGLSGYWACSANIYCRRIMAIIDKDGEDA